MALINRLSRLLRADLHAVLDRVEEPEVLLRQAVREMDTALAEDRRRAKLLEHEQGQLARREHEAGEALSRIATELDLCFEAGQEDLARRLVKRRLELERAREQLQRRHAAQDEVLSQLRQSIEENQARLDAMREKAELLAEEDATRAPDHAGVAGFGETAISSEDVEIAFLGEKRRRSQS